MIDELHAVTPPREETFLGECVLHGWHGKPVCLACREVGQVVVQIKSREDNFYTAHVSESLLRFRGGGREKLRQESRCRMCLRPRGPDSQKEWLSVGGEPGSRALTRHHIVPEKWFKYQPPSTRVLRSVDSNVVPLCRPCHDEVEVWVASRRMLRRALGSDEVAFAIQVAGADWFNHRYPSSQG